ncbi:MAG: glycosyltransferase family 39 protein [Caldilineaceae bacterium]
MSLRHLRLGAVLLLALVLHLLLWLPLPLLVQTLAALSLVGFLPGTLLVELLIGQSAAPPDGWARVLYSIALGYGVITVVILVLSYLPGGLAAWQIYLAVDLLLLILLSYPRRSVGMPSGRSASLVVPPLDAERPHGVPTLCVGTSRSVLGGLIILLLVAGFLRFTNLGYAEFQGDEGRAVLRAAAVMQGYENALFLHRKGPVEILLPTLVYALTGHLTEATARLPFALANLAGVVAIFVLGWRMFHPVAGWVAALLLAVDGYMIGFARIVQYQSIVILTSVLVVLILHQLVQRPAGLQRYLALAGLLLATGLLAHYEAALVIVPSLYLLWLVWRRHQPPHFVFALGIAAVVTGVTAGLFYIPYLLNPAFQNTYAYLTDERIGGHFPYNNLADFFLRTTLYDTTYAVLLLIALATLALLRIYWRALRSPWRWVWSAFALFGLALTFVKDNWLTLGGTDYTFAFFLILFAGALFLPQKNRQALTGEIGTPRPLSPAPCPSPPATRALWLWFGALFILSLFFVGKPRTHVYVFFMPWVLLAGMIVAAGWQSLRTRWGPRWTNLAGGIAALLLLAVFGSYAYWYFVYNQVEIYRTWDTNRPAGFWTVYQQPDDRSLFGFPLQNGWKTVGMLYADGLLQGPYETNDVDNWVTDWYVHKVDRCLRDQQYYILADSLERKSQARKQALLQKMQQGYQLFGTVLVNGQPRLQIYQKNGTVTRPQTFSNGVYAQRFDQVLSDPQFPLDNPVIEPAIAHPLHVGFGAMIWLEGYALDQTTVKPGAVLNLTLYWRTTGRIEQKYTVFNQVLSADRQIVGQLDGQPGCAALPTNDWSVGELLTDHYRVPIAPTTAAGSYRLVTGMYEPKTGVRLTVKSAPQRTLDNGVELTQITVQTK